MQLTNIIDIGSHTVFICLAMERVTFRVNMKIDFVEFLLLNFFCFIIFYVKTKFDMKSHFLDQFDYKIKFIYMTK